MHRTKIALALSVFMSVFVAEAPADIITLTAIDSGWYATDVTQATGNENYVVGTFDGVAETRNFFVFDLANVTQTIIGAELRLYNPSSAVVGDFANGFKSNTPNETFALFDVSTPIASLTNQTAGSAGFNDLGSGANYGSHVFSSADNGKIVSIALNANALTDLNAATGLFGMGGVISTLEFGTGVEQYAFGFTIGPERVSNTTRQLVLTTVPEPSSLALLVFFLFGSTGLRLRSRCATGNAAMISES